MRIDLRRHMGSSWAAVTLVVCLVTLSGTGLGSAVADDDVRGLVGNPNLDPSTLPEGVRKALGNINKMVSETKDCSTPKFTVAIPTGWQCRKLDANPQDVTLYTANNTLNLTLGTSQGRSSCDVIPGCSNDPIELSPNFTGTRKLVQPMLGSVEIVGIYAKDPAVKFLVTSNDTISKKELGEIKTALDSVRRN